MPRFLSKCLILALGLATARALPPASPDTSSASTVTLPTRTQIPGETLKPGKYSIQVLDHLSDRMIVRMEDASGKTHVIFLAVPNTALSGQSAPGGAIAWKTDLKGSSALRGFKFPSGYTVEFVYPKAEAAALAKSNQGNVLAVDPDSEGKPELRKMSSEDMQMVHLWMLSLTKTGADNKTPAIEAQAYQPPAPPQPVQVAANSAPASLSGGASTHASTTAAAPRTAPRRHPVIAVLPHTASSLPLLGLAAMLSLLAATLLHFGLGNGRSRITE